jgi:arsenite methyltransferase
VFPEAVHSCKIVDLGCGAGRDCFVLSELVGPSGFVIGIDFTKEQVTSQYTSQYI